MFSGPDCAGLSVQVFGLKDRWKEGQRSCLLCWSFYSQPLGFLWNHSLRIQDLTYLPIYKWRIWLLERSGNLPYFKSLFKWQRTWTRKLKVKFLTLGSLYLLKYSANNMAVTKYILLSKSRIKPFIKKYYKCSIYYPFTLTLGELNSA